MFRVLEMVGESGEVPWEMAMLMISLQKGRSAVEFHFGLIFGKQTLDETRPRSPGGNKLLMWGSGFESLKKILHKASTV